MQNIHICHQPTDPAFLFLCRNMHALQLPEPRDLDGWIPCWMRRAATPEKGTYSTIQYVYVHINSLAFKLACMSRATQILLTPNHVSPPPFKLTLAAAMLQHNTSLENISVRNSRNTFKVEEGMCCTLVTSLQ